MNLLSPVAKCLNIQYEKTTDDKHSWQLGVYFIMAQDIKGFSITPEYRMYFSSQTVAPEGFFLAPYLRFVNYKTTDTEYNYSGVSNTATSRYNYLRPGFIAGYQWLFSKKVSCELFIGPFYSIALSEEHSSIVNNDDSPEITVDGYGLRAGLCIGISL